MKKLEAKVAAILSEHLVAFNAGKNAGVSEGDTVRLYTTTSIKDPDTGENLGSVGIPKLKFRVNHVQEKLCVGTVSDYEEPSRQANVLTPRRLKTISKDPLSEDTHSVFVAVGDRAVIDISDEEEEPPF
ncbi:FlgT C-terminal domain-containing protein [Micromonospora sp. SL1-18]|uniref:FlgT C-terminal domain-containing protein n=1 Tax=Micromonospora sp. SL1-18 TaxID=3399128 RepID=UPI003A4E66CC